jgi:hypothetical protein
MRDFYKKIFDIPRELGNLSKIKAIPEFEAQVLNSGVDFLPLSQEDGLVRAGEYWLHGHLLGDDQVPM